MPDYPLWFVVLSDGYNRERHYYVRCPADCPDDATNLAKREWFEDFPTIKDPRVVSCTLVNDNS